MRALTSVGLAFFFSQERKKAGKKGGKKMKRESTRNENLDCSLRDFSRGWHFLTCFDFSVARSKRD